ncbi:MAG: type II toxin-antitoxin system VapC family toxin, partial [Acidobacteriota bacterium]|nr:type II toxin-antitoxin system VapC family toxin [Acidobacteriota bacterium]
MPVVLDTHAWIWWVTSDRRLSRRARAAIQKPLARGEVWISMISIWEMAKKVEKGQLALDRPLDEWVEAALSAEGLHVAEMTRPILVDSCRLPLPFHGDPADQIIVATARSLSATVVTKDA